MNSANASSDLFRPARAVARHEAGLLLEKVDWSCRALSDADHPEALHDFRVAVRRLRTYCSAYRRQLPFTAGDRRRLRKLARATNSARDTEVMLATLEAYRKAHPRLGPGPGELIGRLALSRDMLYAQILVKLPRRWGRLSGRLWRHLEPTAQIDLAGPNYIEASAAVCRADLERLQAQALRCTEAWSLQNAHLLRIAIKRLRYLLEGLAPRLAQIGEPIGALRQAQDLFGELHDLHVLDERLPAFLFEAAEQRVGQELLRLQRPSLPRPRADALHRRDPLPALLGLYHHLQRRSREREQWIREHYLAHDLPRLLKGLEAVASALLVHQ